MTTPSPTSRTRALLISAAAAAGVMLGAAGIAQAQTDDSSSTTTAPAAEQTAPDTARQDPATLPNGPGETVLTGSEAEQVTAAALATVPDATVVRVETDAHSDAAYEAHIQLSDGSYQTLTFDENFALLETQEDFGGGHGGRGGHGHGQDLDDDDSTAEAGD